MAFLADFLIAFSLTIPVFKCNLSEFSYLDKFCHFLPIVASLDAWKKPIRSSVSTFAIGYNLPKIAQKYTFRPILQIYWQKKETFSSNIRLVFKNNSCIGHYLVLCCCPKVVLTVLLKKQVLDNRWRLLVPRHKNFDSVGCIFSSGLKFRAPDGAGRKLQE